MPTPSTRSVLRVLRRERLTEVARHLGAVLPPSGTKEQFLEHIATRAGVELAALLPLLARDELRAACRAHEIDDSGRSRTELASRLIPSRAPGAYAPPSPDASQRADRAPLAPGAVAVVRERQYLVTDVVQPPRQGDLTLVRMVCLDDDAQGRALDVLWEHELGARVLEPSEQGLGEASQLDKPRDFAAYWHALQWNRVTATSPRLFQAPFRAGIQLKDYQLTPLMKALELPRANLFIADDVGLGKTIEAGLVLQELLLRQRVDWVLVVCPAAVTTQWRIEMEQRFGIRFEIYDRALVAQRRQERGFAVNPWSTHSRFILSYSLLRRPEYREPLMRLLGEHRKARSLLILDEAHTAAPAAASQYAVDSEITKAIRAIAPRFENRLFLSARAATMSEHQRGLTETYNRMKDAGDRDREVVELRELSEEVDRAVLAAYGWTDIEVPAFEAGEEDPARQRFEDEVLDRLFALNAERAEKERLAAGRRTATTFARLEPMSR